MRAFAYLTAMLLALIGIGVGLVGGVPYVSPPMKSYGVGEMRFVAAFPSLTGGSFFASASSGTLTSYDAWNYSGGDYLYDASVVVISLSDPEGSRLARMYSGELKYYRTQTSNRAGAVTIASEPRCQVGTPGIARNACSAIEVVRSPNLFWFVRAVSEADDPQVAVAFVNSFTPSGSGASPPT